MKLVNVTEIEPSTYNPRVADPERLDLIELSLRKLGFLLPLYATPDGEIISGHQRHHVACRMGATQVPLEVTRSMDLAERKGVNVVFNRATNDLGQSDTVAKINEQLKAADVRKLAEGIPDKAVDTPEFYPCLGAKLHPIAPFLKANKGRWKNYSLNIAKTLKRRGITMPVVATRDYRVVNGIGRLQHCAELGLAQVPVVFVTDAEGALAEAMLNFLSMDFDIHRRYEDLLRHNSFRRLRQVRNSLGRGFIFAVAGDSTAKAFDINDPANRERWIKQHGRCVLDFGAGHLHETRILRKLGISVTPFEPYRVDEGDEIDKAASVALAREFLNVTYIDRPFNYDPVTQTSQRQTTKAIDQVTMNLPIVMGATQAKQVADITLYGTWKERISFAFSLPPQYVRIEPTDIITVNVSGVPHEMRVVKTDMEPNGMMKVNAVAEDISSYDFYSPPGETGNNIQPPQLVPDTLVQFIDAPPLPVDTVQNQGLLRIGVAADGPNWNGAAIYRSDDGGEDGGNTFNPLAGLDGAATFGAIITDLAHGISETWDEFSTVEVLLSSGSLASVSELAVLNGANAALIGEELVQFQNATLIAESTYRLSRLLRGRQGTEWAMGLHDPGDRFVLLSPALYTTAIANNLIGRELFYKVVSVGNAVGNTGEIAFTYTGKNLKPFAPVHVTGLRDGSSNLTIGWVRRSRVGAEWRDGVDIPLGEESERYEVEILDGATVKRTLSATSPTVAYSAAQQVTDFGAAQSSVSVRVYQLSTVVGRGYPAGASI